jgi:hypothetical protein
MPACDPGLLAMRCGASDLIVPDGMADAARVRSMPRCPPRERLNRSRSYGPSLMLETLKATGFARSSATSCAGAGKIHLGEAEVVIRLAFPWRGVWPNIAGPRTRRFRAALVDWPKEKFEAHVNRKILESGANLILGLSRLP